MTEKHNGLLCIGREDDWTGLTPNDMYDIDLNRIDLGYALDISEEGAATLYRVYCVSEDDMPEGPVEDWDWDSLKEDVREIEYWENNEAVEIMFLFRKIDMNYVALSLNITEIASSI